MRDLEGRALETIGYCARLDSMPDCEAIESWMVREDKCPQEIGHIGFFVAYALVDAYGLEADRRLAASAFESQCEPFAALRASRASTDLRYIVIEQKLRDASVFHPEEVGLTMTADSQIRRRLK